MRVFELARELAVTSKVMLDKCRAEGIELKNHMAALSAGLEATIREWFSEGSAATAVETSEHIDLEQARAAASKSRRRRGKGAEEDALSPEAPAPEPAEPAEPASPAEAPEAPEAPAPVEPLVEALEPVAQAPEAPAPAPDVAPVEEAAPPPPLEPPPPPVVEKPKIVPAGHRLIPRPAILKGPTVIRVERADIIPLPRRGGPRRNTTGATAGPVPAAETPRKRPAAKPGLTPAPVPGGEDDKTKKRKRSPRRRTGRSAEGGQLIQEWRNQDILERTERLAAATGGGLRRHRSSVPGKKAVTPVTTIQTGRVEIEEPVTIKNLSAVTGVKAPDLLKKLLQKGVMATINTALDNETAETLMMDWNIELAVVKAKTREQNLLAPFEVEPTGEKERRAPVVTFLGHVDHGKTSLLDRIRTTRVAAGEAGGITQHIGAYRYDKDDKHVVFLDTPGHEAFTAMRARGANMTDVVVLVVAADDGVMPQTAEAISHAKAAGVPIVVALNKVDLPNANVQKALGQLAEHGLSTRAWGGTTEVIHTSAATGEGIDTLLETLSLEADILELQAIVDAPASGYVIESQLDPGRGAVARLLIRNGTLHPGDVLTRATFCWPGRVTAASARSSTTWVGPCPRPGPAPPSRSPGSTPCPRRATSSTS
ncbi:MAG: translation initiation factor IF-2 N-terminal domain-containing protein [Planctomycetota bacterium]|nr:translation initiation factor IF-2 N-terminal domain-containing protein [Planctomycetota bacterium]